MLGKSLGSGDQDFCTRLPRLTRKWHGGSVLLQVQATDCQNHCGATFHGPRWTHQVGAPGGGPLPCLRSASRVISKPCKCEVGSVLMPGQPRSKSRPPCAEHSGNARLYLPPTTALGCSCTCFLTSQMQGRGSGKANQPCQQQSWLKVRHLPYNCHSIHSPR